MSHFHLKLILAVGIFLSPFHGAHAADIQMLPPVDFSNNPCAGANAGILYWEGTTAIKCIPGSSGDASGNIVIGPSLTIQGETLGPLNSHSSDTVNSLRNLAVCPAGQVLTKTGPNAFACTSGLPACQDGQMVIYNNGVPACTSPATGTPVLAKDTGFVCLSQFNSTVPLSSSCSNWTYYNAIIAGLAANGITPTTNLVDYTTHTDVCEYGTLDGGTHGTTYADPNVTIQHSDCQKLVCEGIFGQGVKLYSYLGGCNFDATNPSCAFVTPNAAVRMSCFY
jgi:hypothetical protein